MKRRLSDRKRGIVVFILALILIVGLCPCRKTDAMMLGTACPSCGHMIMSMPVNSSNATCTTPSITTYLCSNCGTYFEVTGSTTGHDTVTTTIAATCTEAGSVTSHCTKCGYSETMELPALGHDYYETVIEATCTEAGEKKKLCTRCDEVTLVETIPAKGHSFPESWKVEKAATVTTEGLMSRTCTECGYKETSTISRLGVSPTSGPLPTPTEKPQTGTDGGKTGVTPTVTKAPDITESGTGNNSGKGTDAPTTGGDRNVQGTDTGNTGTEGAAGAGEDAGNTGTEGTAGAGVDAGTPGAEGADGTDPNADDTTAGTKAGTETDAGITGTDGATGTPVGGDETGTGIAGGSEGENIGIGGAEIIGIIAAAIAAGGVIAIVVAKLVKNGTIGAGKAGSKVKASEAGEDGLNAPELETKTLGLCLKSSPRTKKLTEAIEKKKFLLVKKAEGDYSSTLSELAAGTANITADCAIVKLIMDEKPELILVEIDTAEELAGLKKLAEYLEAGKSEAEKPGAEKLEVSFALVVNGKLAEAEAEQLTAMKKSKAVSGYASMSKSDEAIITKLVLPIYKPEFSAENVLEVIGNVAESFGIPVLPTVISAVLTGKDIKEAIGDKKLSLDNAGEIIGDIAEIFGFDVVGDVADVVDALSYEKEKHFSD